MAVGAYAHADELGAPALAVASDAVAFVPEVRTPQKRRKGRSQGVEPLTRAQRVELEALEAELRAEGALRRMPKTFGECPPAGEVCPHIRCRHHLAITISDLHPTAVKIEHALDSDSLDLAELRATCSLHAATEGPRSLEETGRLCGFTLERTRQVEAVALSKIRRRLARDENIPPVVRAELARLLTAGARQ